MHVIARNSGESVKHNTVSISIYCMLNLNHEASLFNLNVKLSFIFTPI
jgi:hypothetical protein